MVAGSINHVALTVTDLDTALPFFDGLLGFLGYRRRDVVDYPPSGSRLAIYVHAASGSAVNVWAAWPQLRGHRHERYAPGLHHIAFNVAAREAVDTVARAVPGWGGTLLDGPGDYPYEKDGYYAVYFSGPDGMKFECVYMPSAQ